MMLYHQCEVSDGAASEFFDKIFTEKGHLKSHQKIHGNEAHKCDICEKTVCLSMSFEGSHQNTHLRKRIRVRIMRKKLRYKM